MMDEVVVAVKASSPVPCVEVHCHGGREVIRLLLETFAAHGLRVCSWQEFERRANGDSLRSDAVVALADAVTARTSGILLDQYHGAFARAIQEILACWESETGTTPFLSDADDGTRLLQSLVRNAGLGRHLTVPWRVVVAGAPNVGKSSLINALAGYQRCVVSPTPGTTRDLVTTLIAIDGWPIELTDTAGLRADGEMLEAQGIALARQAACEADLCLWILDASAPPVWPDFQLQAHRAQDRGAGPFFLRFVVNKVDLVATWDLDGAVDAVRVSALDARGLGDLCKALSGWLLPEPPPGAPVPFTASLCTQIEEAWRHHAAGHFDEARQVLESIRKSV
jgi:tRNA modification GTPase